MVSSVYSPLRGVFSHTGFWTANEVTGDAIVSPPTATGWYDGGQYMHFIIMIGILSWLILKNFGIGCIGELYLLIIL